MDPQHFKSNLSDQSDGVGAETRILASFCPVWTSN